ncbi:hypothetical protein Droror1_Dr00018196, partial [Drosera rotundifolia]
MEASESFKDGGAVNENVGTTKKRTSSTDGGEWVVNEKGVLVIGEKDGSSGNGGRMVRVMTDLAGGGCDTDSEEEDLMISADDGVIVCARDIDGS